MMQRGYTATGKVLKLYFRNGRAVTLLLLFLPFLFAYATAASNMAVLKTPEQLNTYIAENQGNLLLGTIAANTIAAVTVWRIRISAAIIMSILSTVLMINSTRKEEEQGRLELLRAGAVGPKAPLTAALIKLFCANLLGGLMMAAGFIAAGFPAAGSFTAGAATALCVCCFAAMASIAAQEAPNARLARGFFFGVIAFFFAFQFMANAAGNEKLLLWTPFGFCTGDFASSIVRLPAVWLIASAVVFIYGFIPRAAAAAGWGLFGASLFFEFLWEIRVIGNQVFKLSPFSWVYPGKEISFTPIFTMLLIAGVLTGLGLIGFSRRDIIAE